MILYNTSFIPYIFTEWEIILFRSSRCIIWGVGNAKFESLIILTDQIYLGFVPKVQTKMCQNSKCTWQVYGALFDLKILLQIQIVL